MLYRLIGNHSREPAFITNKITNKFAFELNPDVSRVCGISVEKRCKMLGTTRFLGAHQSTRQHKAEHAYPDSDSACEGSNPSPAATEKSLVNTVIADVYRAFSFWLRIRVRSVLGCFWRFE